MISNHDISADYNSLMEQAAPTVMVYVRAIRKEMGETWVEQNPQAFATLVQAAAIDFHGSCVGKEIGKLTQAVADLAPYLGRNDE